MARTNGNGISARARGLRGAVIGTIIMAVFIVIFDASMAASGSPVAVEDKTRYLGMLAVAPLYGFGYAFGYKKMLNWFAKALHFSGEITLAALLWWVLTGSKKGFLRGFFVIYIMFAAIAGAAWMPGIPMGIKAIRAERKETIARGTKAIAAGGKNAAEKGKALIQKGKSLIEEKKGAITKKTEEPKKEFGTQEGFTPNPELNRQMKEYSDELQAEKTAKEKHSAADKGISSVPSMPAAGSTLRCFGGEFAGASFDLSDGKEIVIGRDPGQSSIVLNDPKISRAHCKIRYSAKDGCGMVKDISSNGISFLDGRQIPKNEYVKVKNGDGIRLGQNGPVFLFS